MSGAERWDYDREKEAQVICGGIMENFPKREDMPDFFGILTISGYDATSRQGPMDFGMQVSMLREMYIMSLADETCNKLFWHHYIPLRITEFRESNRQVARFMHLAIIGPEAGPTEEIARDVGSAVSGYMREDTKPDGYVRDQMGGPTVSVYLDRWGLGEKDDICYGGVDTSPLTESEIGAMVLLLRTPPDRAMPDLMPPDDEE